MPITFTPAWRALATGGTAAAILAGAFALGTTASSAAPSSTTQYPSSTTAGAGLTPAAGPARITVTGTGTVNGTPSQLVLSIGVQVSATTVGSALTQASQAVRRVTTTLKTHGVAAADIQTSDLSIQPNFRGSAPTPDGYGASESLTATLRRLSAAGTQISAATRAGGNATTINGISLNLTDTSTLLARARTAAVTNAKVKATQYATALGLHLGPVISITDQAPAQPFPFPAAGPAASRASSVPISPGTQQLSVSITVIYAIP